jgi:S1-C subfamily serine protease
MDDNDQTTDAATTEAAATEANSEATAFRTATTRRRTIAAIAGITAGALAFAGGGVALGYSIAVATGSSSSATVDAGGNSSVVPGMFRPTQPFGGSSDGSTSGSNATTQTSATPATDAQKVGVVTIVSKLYYSESSAAAGTGIILSSTGEILTNNHVIDGATSIEVTVESTGKTYTASVVGSDSTDDIAVLQLEGATGLTPATIDATATPAVSDAVTSVGNAGGTGDLVVASGTVSATNESISVGSEYSSKTEKLSGLIEVDADVVSGDSGGPLLDAQGNVIGIVTAASSGSANITGFAIPIDTAMTIAQQIEAGNESGNVRIGLPGFLGVQVATTQGSKGVTVGGTISGSGAEKAGLAKGDIITAVNGAKVSTPEALSSAITALEPGATVRITYLTTTGSTTTGSSKTISVTLTEGPAA